MPSQSQSTWASTAATARSSAAHAHRRPTAQHIPVGGWHSAALGGAGAGSCDSHCRRVCGAPSTTRSPATAVVRLALANRNCQGAGAPPLGLNHYLSGSGEPGAPRGRGAAARGRRGGGAKPSELPALGPPGEVSPSAVLLAVGGEGGETQNGLALPGSLTRKLSLPGLVMVKARLC